MTIPLHCLHCGSEARVARRPCPLMVNKRIAVTLVGVAAVRILPPMPIHKLAARRVCMPLKNASLLRGLTRIDRRSLEQPSPVGSKKGAQLPPLHATLLAPDPEDRTSTTLELDERMARLCSKKRTTPGCGLPCAARRVKWSPMRLRDRSRQDVSTLVGGHSSSLPLETLRNVLLGGIQGGDPRGATYGCRKRDRRNLPRRALEEQAASTFGSFCSHDVLVFKVRAHARGVSSALSPSLPSPPGYPSQMSHYPF